MAIFTKTFVRCDACDQELEMPSNNGSGNWVRVRTEIRRLDENEGEVLVKRSAELCSRCYSALQDSEFSTLFEAGSPESTSSVVPISGSSD